MIIDAQTICDTVCKLASAGKQLPRQLPGQKDPYDAMCDSFIDIFGDRHINLDTWKEAERNYIRGSSIYLAPSYMEEELSRVQHSVPKTPGEDFKKGLSDEAYWRRFRTAARLRGFTARMFRERIHIMDFLPSEEEGRAVGLRHGFTEEDLDIPTEKGGQLLAIRAFMAEWKAFTTMKRRFPYKMGVKNKEVEWLKA